MKVRREMARATTPAVVETPLSTLFFYGDRVLKVRRPVVHGIVDYRSLDRRGQDCDREVALNRCLAPDVYLGTATVSMDDTVIEHAVAMRRLPKERNLATLVRRGRASEVQMERVANVLARFHAGADRSARIDAAGTGDALWQRWQGTEEELARFVGPVVDVSRYRELTSLASRYVEGRGPLFRRRIAEGAVCDGHGSLEVADVFCLEDGPRILGRLVFDEERRYGDVLADVGSLVQDLELCGGRTAADWLVSAYRRSSGREHVGSLLHFYVARAAHLRLLTQCLRQEQGLRLAVRPVVLVDQAIEHLRTALPRLVLVGGLPASGKSTVAGWVGAQLGAEVLSASQARQRAGAAPGAERQAAPPPARPRQSVYQRLCDRARDLLGTGRSVVLDAGWWDAADRRLAVEVARKSAAEYVALRCQCPREERAARLAARRAEGWTGALGPEALEDPWPEALVVDTSSVGSSAGQHRRRRGRPPLGPPAANAG